ncbi:hypothetical protein SZSBPVYA_CDS0030 [Pseudomonas phage PBJ]|nr:hypothetical protein SZSBPVYA_CDS0030 [Pseudomonas phage PBJ]
MVLETLRDLSKPTAARLSTPKLIQITNLPIKN